VHLNQGSNDEIAEKIERIENKLGTVVTE